MFDGEIKFVSLRDDGSIIGMKTLLNILSPGFILNLYLTVSEGSENVKDIVQTTSCF